MATTYVNESFVDIYNTVDQSEAKENDSRMENYDTLDIESRNELAIYQTLDKDKSKQEDANEGKGLKTKCNATCAFRAILTVVVTAVVIAVIISFTTNTKSAKVDGGWSSWEDWGSCTVSCGIGMTSRNRTCDHPVPQGSGVQCPGTSLENKLCFPGSCSNSCQSHPCNYGNCRPKGDSFECLCFLGYTGRYCENEIDDCATQPCLNGSCNDLVNGYSCSCFAGFSGVHCQTVITDCVDILRNNGSSPDGIYTVRTWKRHQLINVYCDMTTDGGGWTVFQNRLDGSIDFYRKFSEYDTGFGNLTTEFWLGLRKIQEIADQDKTDLRIDLEAANGTKAYETFDSFYLSPGPAYTLHIGSTIASLRISSSISVGQFHNGSDFSTYDRDADSYTGNCAAVYHGAWWYKFCSRANLNGEYLTPGTDDSSGMTYYSFMNYRSLRTSRMMMRRE